MLETNGLTRRDRDAVVVVGYDRHALRPRLVVASRARLATVIVACTRSAVKAQTCSAASRALTHSTCCGGSAGSTVAMS